MTFEKRIREARLETGFTLREAAALIQIRIAAVQNKGTIHRSDIPGKKHFDFTYLSKLESGTKPPGSPDVISAIASVLDIDAFELFCLAGKFPPELRKIYGNDPGFRQFLRAVCGEIPENTDWNTLCRRITGDKPRVKKTRRPPV